MIVGRAINKVINVFTGFFAISTLVLMLVWYINHVSGGLVLSADGALATVERMRNYFTLATIFCAGAEFTLKRNLILAIIFACVVVAVALFMIYTDVTAIG